MKADCGCGCNSCGSLGELTSGTKTFIKAGLAAVILYLIVRK